MKSFTFALLVALLSTDAALAQPTLKGDITVNTDIVTVGDMFDNPGELSETAIFRAPAPGTTGIVPLADIQNAARQIGLTDYENVGYTRIRVMRLTTVVDAPVLSNLIGAELSRRGVLANGVTADTHFDLANVSLNASQVDTPVTLGDLRYTPQTGQFSARFMIAGIDQPVDLTGTVQLMTKAPRLLDTYAAGTVLAAADFELADVPLATASAGGYADLDQLVGKQLLRQSRSGIMLKPTDVVDPTVVTRNALVTAYIKAGAMTLTVKGQALGTASAGQPVDILNIVTKKVLHGVARADGTVQILNATTVASL
jgi:flagella basal body P-ring formation protein FlgA